MPNKEAVIYPPLDKLPAATMARLLAISPYLHATLDQRKLLGIIMNVAVELTGAEDAAVLLVNEATNYLQFEATTRTAVSKEVIIPLDDSLAGWVLHNGRSLRLADVTNKPQFATAVDKELLFGLRSFLGVPLRADNGRWLGVLALINKKNGRCFSATDQHASEALAAQAVVALNNARLFAQSDLLAEIVHELKTPMMAITTATELLLRPDLPPANHTELIKMIQRESHRLAGMAQDFLDFARLESGRVRLTHRPIDLNALIAEVVHISQPQALARNITIQAELPPHFLNGDGDQAIMGDEARVKQILLNLLSNAVKYGRENGTVTIRAHSDGREVCLAVQDDGVGIEPQDLQHLFERFYRVPDREGGSEGSGLGLAIAKKLVDQHNGRISVSSAPGEGTTFTVYLPISQLPHLRVK